MSAETSYAVTLKMRVTESGIFESIRLLKGRSKLSEDVLERLNKVLQESLIPALPVRTTVAIGDDYEQKIMNHLLTISQLNSDFSVNDTSSKTGHGDIAVEHQGFKVCIEAKSYSKPVPMKEIDKYHKSLALPEYAVGIMIQSNACGYAREANLRSPIDIRVIDGKPSAYLTATSLDLLYPLIEMLLSSVSLECPIDQAELEKKRKALLAIHEEVTGLRSCIDAQRKTIVKMETMVDKIAKLSLE